MEREPGNKVALGVGWVLYAVFSVIFSHVYFSFFSFSIFQLWIAGSTIYLLSKANDNFFFS